MSSRVNQHFKLEITISPMKHLIKIMLNTLVQHIMDVEISESETISV